MSEAANGKALIRLTVMTPRVRSIETCVVGAGLTLLAESLAQVSVDVLGILM